RARPGGTRRARAKRRPQARKQPRTDPLSQDAAALEGRPRGLKGPTAFTGDWRRFWDLLIITSVSSFRRSYIDTTFGFVWMILGPLINFGVLYVFITVIVR